MFWEAVQMVDVLAIKLPSILHGSIGHITSLDSIHGKLLLLFLFRE